MENLTNAEVLTVETDEIKINAGESRDSTKLNTSNMPENLQREYEAVFDGEEKTIHQFYKIKSNLKLERRKIDYSSISIPEFKKLGRVDTVRGLTAIVKEWGVVNPIHVLELEDEGQYMLLDGTRRLFAGVRSGIDKFDCYVWNFSDKDEGKQCSNIVSLMLNRSQHNTVRESWEMMQKLESVNELGMGAIEHLLQLNAGDAMKMKDVMQSDMEFLEIKEALLAGELTIDSAYKKLCNARKKEDRLAKEDEGGVELITTMEGTVESAEAEPSRRLAVEDVNTLLELAVVDEISDVLLEDLDRSVEVRGVDYQTTGDRRPVDPAIKQATLARDDCSCRCCGKGNREWLGVLVYHHVVPVFCGGPDTVENGLTLCANCHMTLHLYAEGKLSVDLKSLSEDDIKIFKNIFRFGNVIIEASKRIGLSREEFIKKDAPSRRHMYPGENIGINTQAYQLKETLKAKG